MKQHRGGHVKDAITTFQKHIFVHLEMQKLALFSKNMKANFKKNGMTRYLVSKAVLEISLVISNRIYRCLRIFMAIRKQMFVSKQDELQKRANTLDEAT